MIQTPDSPAFRRFVADALDIPRARPAHVLAGFDGFVDQIIHVVDTRADARHFEPMRGMAQLAERIQRAAGYSANIELVVQQEKLGGNGPIMANGLASLGCAVDYIGALGEAHVHPVFGGFAAACRRVISLCDPGTTDALEFHDGKVMLGKMTHLKAVNWGRLLQSVPKEDLAALVEEVDLLAFTNWTMLPEMNSLLEGFGALVEASANPPPLFVDLTDPAKRHQEDLVEVLELLAGTGGKTRVMLGMNARESEQVASAILGEVPKDLSARARAIRERLGLDLAVIHPVDGAAVSTPAGEATIQGPYTPTPKLTTGAGDNFNAGFCYGLVRGLSPAQALVSAVGTSGFYVREARSPTAAELTQFIRDWAGQGA